MQRSFLILIALWVLALPALAQQPYQYYEVHRGDTVESVAAAHGLSVATVLRCNARQIIDGQGLNPGTILVLPLASAAPAPSAASVAPAAPASPEAAAAPRASAARRPAPSTVGSRALAAHRNVFVGSDGRALHFPVRVRPVPQVAPEPEEDDSASAAEPGRGRLASRSGRPVRGLLAAARRYLGTPYVWGGEDPTGFDCSGYVQYLCRLQGVYLPRTADLQFLEGRAVPPGKERPGDLVFFETYAPGASHVGLYLGGGDFIHASSVGYVRISNLFEDYFSTRYLGARRVF